MGCAPSSPYGARALESYNYIPPGSPLAMARFPHLKPTHNLKTVAYRLPSPWRPAPLPKRADDDKSESTESSEVSDVKSEDLSPEEPSEEENTDEEDSEDEESEEEPLTLTQMNDPAYLQERAEAKTERQRERAEAKLERAEAKVERAEERAEYKLDREQERVERKEERKIEKGEAKVLARREAKRRAKWQDKKDVMVNEAIFRIDNAEPPREVYRDRDSFLDNMEMHANNRQNYNHKTTKKIREKRIKTYSNMQKRKSTTISLPKYETSALLTKEQVEEKLAAKEEEWRIAYGGDADDESENRTSFGTTSFNVLSDVRSKRTSFGAEAAQRRSFGEVSAKSRGSFGEVSASRRSTGEVSAQRGNLVRSGFQNTGRHGRDSSTGRHGRDSRTRKMSMDRSESDRSSYSDRD